MLLQARTHGKLLIQEPLQTVETLLVCRFGGASGLVNTAEFLVEGRVKSSQILKSRTALPLDGNVGGLLEFIIDPANVRVTNISSMTPSRP